MLPPAVLWADPGKMTGVARIRTCPASASSPPVDGPQFDVDEYTFYNACVRIEAMCRDYRSSLAIGW